MDISILKENKQKRIAVFCCYAHEDEELLKKLKFHLMSLQHEGLITVWHDRNISAGAVWEEEIKWHLSNAHIILLLISSNFMDSQYDGVEMQHALMRHENGEATVIPIILRPTHWYIEPLKQLQALPTNGKPVTTWDNEDDAFFTIVLGIRSEVETRKPRKAAEAKQASDRKSNSVFTPPRHLPKYKTIVFAGMILLLIIMSGLEVFTFIRSKSPSTSSTPTTSTTPVNTNSALVDATVSSAIISSKNPYSPYRGTLLFDTSLSQNPQNYSWDDLREPGEIFCSFINGAYHAEVSMPSTWNDCSIEAINLANFTYQVQMMIVNGDQGGIAFRANNSEGSFYYFHIGTDGTYQFDILSKHHTGKTLRYGSSPAIRIGRKQPNLIAVVAQGNTIDLYINVQLVVHETDTAFSSGQIGVVANENSDPTEAAFSNAKVWTL